MKRMFKKMLSMLLVVSTFAVLSACSSKEKKSNELSKEELSVLYKDIALSTWEKIGVDDPTIEASTLSVSIPDKKEETTNEHNIKNILMNGNTMAGLIYMISLLYANEDFITTDNIAIFDVTTTIMGETHTQNYILETYVDMDDNKVYLQAAITTMNIVQYSSVEADYDFDKEELKSYRFYSNVMTSYVDMALTEDNKYMWYETSTEGDEVASAITAKKQEFLNRSAEVSKLEVSFDEEIQTYMTILERTIDAFN